MLRGLIQRAVLGDSDSARPARLALAISDLNQNTDMKTPAAAMAVRPTLACVQIDGKMSALYRIACWLSGGAMIGVAVVCSLMGKPSASAHEPAATPWG